MRVRVYPGPFCKTEALDEDGFICLQEGATVADALRQLRYPLLLKMFGLYMVNYRKAKLDTKLQEGDVLSVFAPLAGG